MLTLDIAIESLLKLAKTTDIHTISTSEADGYILANHLYAPIPLPLWNNSAMDGFCLNLDFNQPFPKNIPIVDYILAGTQGKPLSLGNSARIFTGAPLPEGANVVVMQEHCCIKNDFLHIDKIETLKAFQNIRLAGEDIQQNSIAIPKGTKITPRHIALASALGVSQLDVFKPLKIAVVSTGDELCEVGNPLKSAQIYDSNRPMLCAYLKRLGCQITDAGKLPDHFETIRHKFSVLSESHDLILSSGGVSVGEADHVKSVVESLGTLDIWKIAIKPGKPFAYGKVGTADFIGLPGNPVSSLVTLVMLAKSYILTRQGYQNVEIQKQYYPADFIHQKCDKNRSEFLRVQLNSENKLSLCGQQGSAMLSPLAFADGLVQLEPNQTVEKNDILPYISFSDIFI